MGTGIQPAEPSTEQLHREFTLAQIMQIHIGYFQLTPGRWSYGLSHRHHILVIKIETGHRIAGFWITWFFLNTNHLVLAIKLHNAITLRVTNQVAKNNAAILQFTATPHDLAKIMAKKDVISQHQANRVVSNKLFPNNKCLGQSFWPWLFRIPERKSQFRSITQKLLKAGEIVRGGNDENFPDAGKHQDGKRIVDHGFVVDRNQLLAEHPGQWI